MKKRIISMVLAILMICTIVSESIFAEVVGGNSTEVRYAKVETSSYFYVGMTPGAMEQMAGAVDFAKRLVITDETTNSSGTTYYQLSAAENYSWPTTIEGGVQKLTDGVWVKADYVTILKYCDICKDYDCGIEHPTEPEPTTEPVEPSDPVDPSDPVTPPAEDSVSAGVTDKDGNAVLDAKGEPLMVTVEGDLPEGAVVSAVVPEVDGEMLPNVFDIKVLVPNAEGNMVEWQPIDEGKTVNLTIPVETDTEYVDVFHVIDYYKAINDSVTYVSVETIDNSILSIFADAIEVSNQEGFIAVEKFAEVEVNSGVVSFDTNSFSIYEWNGSDFDRVSEGTAQNVTLYNITGVGNQFSYYGTPNQSFKLSTAFPPKNANPYKLNYENTTVYFEQETDIFENEEESGLIIWSRKASLAIPEHAMPGQKIVVDFEGGSGATGTIVITVVREVTVSFASPNVPATGLPNSITKVSDGDEEHKVFTIPSANVTATGDEGRNQFLRWDTKPDGTGTPYTVGDKFTSSRDMTLYAIWNTNRAFVDFDANGGEETYERLWVNLEESGDAKITLPEPPTRPNYRFLGWSTTTDGYADFYEAGAEYTVKQDITLYAIWGVDLTITVSGGTLTLQKDGDLESTPLEQHQYSTGQPIFVYDPEVNNGVTTYKTVLLEGFLKDARFTFKYPSNYKKNDPVYTGAEIKFTLQTNQILADVIDSNGVDENTTISFSAVPQGQKSFTVSYVTNYGSPVAGTVLQGLENDTLYLNSLPTNSDTTRNGYTLEGWYLDKELTQKATAPMVVNQNIVLYAKWTPTVYTITYVTDDPADSYSVDYTIETPVQLPDANKTGWQCTGWKPTATAGSWDSSKTYAGTVSNMYGNVTLEAQWTKNTHTVTYMIDGVQSGAVDTVGYGDTVVIRSAPAAQTGYTFSGWKINGEAATNFTMPDHNVVIEATWSVNSYDVIWKVDGNVVKREENIPYGTTLNLTNPADPTKTGHTFTGWDKTIPTTMPANDVTITAQWKVNQYTITFDTDGGSKIDPITQDYNSAVTAPADPTKAGYTFAGWLPALPDKMPAGNITVKAQWKVQSYTITWNAGLGTFADGTKEKQTSADHGSTPVAPEIPRMSKTGYTCTFAAWEPTINAATGAVTYTATYTESVNSYNYTVKTYTMGTNGQYGEPTTQTFSANYNTLVSITPEVRTGFTVASASTLSGTIPADNGLVLTVYYSRNEYSVTYKVDGEQYGDIDKVFYGSQVAIRQEPTTTGYTFTGWKINGEDAENFTMPANDVTITAQWKINQYTISFNTDGGSKIDPITQDYNSAVTAPADPTKTGYTFAGWDRAIPATMPANNVTITAKWRVNAYTYNVVYKSESGIVLGNAQVTRNFNTTDTITPRDFTGYTTPASQTVVWDNVNSKTITFTYKPVVYKISYELKGGVSGNNPASYTIESNDITLISPAKVGYEFLGWTGTGITDKTPEVKIAKGSIGDRSYTAVWGVDVSATIDNDGTIQLVHNSTTRTWTGSLAAENVEEGAYEGGKLIFNAAEGYKITQVLINDKEVSLNQADLITEYELELPQGVKTECKDIKVTTEKIIVRLDIVIGSGSTQRVVKVMVNSDIIIAVTPPANEKLTSVVLEYADGTKTTVNQLNPAGYVFTSANITQDMRIVVGATTENVHFSIGSVEKGYVELKYGNTTINSTVSAPNPPCLPVGTDYTFKLYSDSGYYIDKINDVATSEMPTTKELGGKAEDGLVYIAESNPFVYNISYNLDGGMIEGVDNPATYTVESESFTLNNPVKKGYFFQGWTGTGLTEKTQTVNVAKGSIGNREYTAIWSVNQYTITFHSNGGTEIVPIIGEYGAAVTAPADPAKTGHSFDAWYTDPELTQKYVFSTMPAKDITLYAKWKINQYTITFNTDGGNEIIPITQDYGTVVTAPADPEKDGYTFIGWYSNAELTQPYTIDKMPANDIALYAKWELALTDLVINTDSIDENQSFVFIVSAQGTAKGDIKLRVALNGTDTIVIKDLPVGEYKVTPVGGWAWRQSLEEQRIDVDGIEDVVTFKWTLMNALVKWLNGYAYKKEG